VTALDVVDFDAACPCGADAHWWHHDSRALPVRIVCCECGDTDPPVVPPRRGPQPYVFVWPGWPGSLNSALAYGRALLGGPG
jgi:hypothetical protein